MAKGAFFKEATVDICAFVLTNQKNNKLIMLKSWNEWGEGNYMEPDIKYGRGYINALRKAIDEVM